MKFRTLLLFLALPIAVQLTPLARASVTYDNVVIENSCKLPFTTVNSVPYLDASQNLVSLPGWSVEPWFGTFSNITLTAPPDAGYLEQVGLNQYVEVALPQSTNDYHPQGYVYNIDVDGANTGNNLNSALGMLVNKTLRGTGTIQNSQLLNFIDGMGNGGNAGTLVAGQGINFNASIGATYTVGDYNLINGSLTNDGSLTGTATLLNLYSYGGAPVNRLLALQFGLNIDVTGDEFGFALNTDHAVGGNLSGMSWNFNSQVAGGFNAINSYMNNTMTIGGDSRQISMGSDAVVSGFAAGAIMNQNGNVTKGWTGFGSYVGGNVGDGTGTNAIVLDANFASGKTIDGALTGFNLYNQSTVTNGINGAQISNYGNYTGDLNFFNAYNQGVMTGTNTLRGLSIFNSGAGHSFEGATVNNSSNQTEEIVGYRFSSTGNARTATGVDVSMQGNITDDGQGLRVNVGNLTSSSTTQHVVSGSFQGGVFQVQGQYSPFSGNNFEIGNNITATATIANGSPLTGSDQILQLIQSNLLVQDDIATGPFGLDTNMVGMVSQLSVDSGKTVPIVRSLILGTTTPSGSGGTVGEFVGLEMLGMPSFGGSVAPLIKTGFQDSQLLGQNLCDNTTDCWGIRIRDVNANNSFQKLAVRTADQKVFSDSAISVGDQAILTGDIHAQIRNVKTVTDPTSYAVAAGYAGFTGSTFTDDSPTAIVGIHNTTKTVVASGKTIGGLAGVFNTVSRVESGDDGTVPFVFGMLTNLASGNSSTKSTGLYAGYFTGFHSIDSNANQIGSMYDFYAQASSIGAGAVTNRYGIVVEADSGYTKQNWLSGLTLLGGSSFSTPTVELDVQGDARIRNLSTGIVHSDSSGNLTSSLLDLASEVTGTLARSFLSTVGHWISTQASAPTATVQANAGTGATCSVASATDTAGQVSITTGTLGLSTGAYCKVNFDSAYGVAPICVLTPASSTLSTSVYVTSTINDMTVNFAVAGGLSSTYLLNYHCVETQ